MSISIHIPFYNPIPDKKEGYRQLTRYDYLKENLENLKKLSLKTDIYIHTHNTFLNDKVIDAKVLVHEIEKEKLNKGYLTWLCRPLIEKQKNDYQYFMYIEHDIKFSQNNFEYYLDHKNNLDKNNFHLGFLIYEKNQIDQNNYCIHVSKKMNKFIMIDNIKYFLNDFENYSCFWLYDQITFKKFIKSKFWKFEKKLTNFRHNYGITERSALGYHAFNINYFKATVLPEINNKPDERCFIEHITNNYFNKFKDNKIDNEYFDIRGVCKFKYNEVFEHKEINIQTYSFKIIIDKFMKIFLWKFRFLIRLFRK